MVASQCLASMLGFSASGLAWDGCAWRQGDTCFLLQTACGISVPRVASFTDGVESLFQGGVVVVVLPVGLDGAKAFGPEVFSAFE